MLTVNARRIAELLSFEVLVPALRVAFAHGERAAVTPQRHRHRIDHELDASLLLGTAWTRNYLGVKVVTVFPRNLTGPLSATYLLSCGRTGRPLAVFDGAALSRRADFAVGALAASYLARPDSRTLLVIGPDEVACAATKAYRTVLGIERVLVHGGAGGRVCGHPDGIVAERCADLREAVRESDVVVCVTVDAAESLRGAWLRSGTHVHLAGVPGQRTREADAEVVGRSAVYVDSPTALAESGELTRLRADQLRGSLFDLCSGLARGRRAEGELTLFKSAGTAIADLAAAALAHDVAAAG
ncbi:ornithine cyclodeaminase family protein [Kutzneria viridogrisea]|uniref:Ornithine cyclodeaminase n=2 Tax=Kutzneria TaxID=43356 RepID=W5WUK1_9PSEU|nr:hypothetical protein [Kutzneria albida]AHI01830.1 hypothetical protein KALB_8473 [Kutzneria albida DSM 43870]MBA8929752.1 ornithine cyclodeaminase [Kutzneria viridogrisea]